MIVKLAQTAGFCMGVRRAVDIVLDIARRKGDGPVYTYGALIHNPQTVELLKRRGVLPAESIDEIERGTVVIRAHGISPRERARLREKDVTVVDATCPKVARVQSIIKKHVEGGYDVIIVGDKKHPEVAGLLGYASAGGYVVGDVGDVDRLPPLDLVCVVSQTTQNTRHFERVSGRIKERFPGALVFNTICDSTERRQAEVMGLAGEVDAMIIVGGRNSANTRKLLEISENSGIPSYQVETADELRGIDLEGIERVGVSAGASTPNWITDGVVDYLTLYRRGRSAGLISGFLHIWLFAVRTDIYSALGAGILAAVSMALQKQSISLVNVLIAAFYVYSMHTLNRIQDRYLGSIKGSFRDETYLRHRKLYMGAAVLALFCALVLALAAGPAAFACLFFISLFGYLYRFKMFPKSWPVESLRDIPGSKHIFIALAWAVVAALIPSISMGGTPGISTGLAFIIVALLVFMKSVITDMANVQSDRLMGRETLPVIMGENNSRRLVRVVSLVLAAILIIPAAAGAGSTLAPAILAAVFYVWICLELCDRRAKFSSTALEGFFGTVYIVAGVAVFLWAAAAHVLY